jgi:hypothetical protein
MMLASRAFLYFPLQLSSGVSQTHAHSWLCFVARESSRRFYRFPPMWSRRRRPRLVIGMPIG